MAGRELTMKTTLFDAPPETKHEAERTDFEQFDAENSQVWREFERLALEIAAEGHKHYSAKAIFEVIRFHRAIRTTDVKWKLNNIWTPYYARKFMRCHPQYEGFFETRRVKDE